MGVVTINIKQLNDHVQAFQDSEMYDYMTYGHDYYRNRNTAIMDRTKEYYVEGLGVKANPFAANHKLPSGYFKKVVDQKVQYLLGNGIVFDSNDPEQLDVYFKHGISEFITDAGTLTSKKAVAYAYAYKDNGQLKFTLLPSEQVTPIYDDRDELDSIIRRFDEGDTKVMLHITDTEIIRYEKREKNKEFEAAAIYGHYNKIQEFNGQQVGEPEPHSFSRLPVIPLYNNKERISDLYPIKQHIDVYDLINSDFANNIDDMQDAFFELKGFDGDSTKLAEFVQQLKQIKSVPTPAEGGITPHQLQVPVKARSTFLELLEHNIYKDSMSVDVSKISGSSITNVVIKAMFTDLDLKADQFESEMRKFMYQLIDFINANDSKTFDKEFKFERSTIMNRAEMTKSITKLNGILSQETIRELLPYDIDLDEEKKRLEDEQGAYLSEPIVEPEEDDIDEPNS